MTSEEIAALKKVRDGLASGEYVHFYDNSKVTKKFIMDQSCGSAACIGGWMAVEMSIEDAKRYVCNSGLEGDMKDLFYPNPGTMSWSEITAAQAVQAIDNFLIDRNPRWEEICND